MNYIRFIVVFLFLSGNLIHAQKEQLTLQKAVKHALSHNPKLHQLEAELNAKSDQWLTATGISDPELIYFKEGMNNNTTPTFEERRIAVSQSIDFPLTSYYRLKKIQQEKKSLEQKFEVTRRKIISNVKNAYVDILYAIYNQRLVNDQLKLAQNLNKSVKTRTEAGAGTDTDKLKAEIQLAQAQNEIDYAERILHQARYELFNKMGLEPENQKYSLNFVDTLRTRDDLIDQETALQHVTDHPAYKAMIKKQNAATYNIKQTKSNYLPDINFSLYRQDYGDGYDFTGFEVGFSIPLWFPLNQNGKIQMAKAEKEKIQWSKTETMLNMKMQIEHAWHNYETSKKSMERFRTIISKKSSKLRSLTLEAYKLGKIGLPDLLSAQQVYLDTRKNFLKALRDYYKQLIKLEKYMNKEIVY